MVLEEFGGVYTDSCFSRCTWVFFLFIFCSSCVIQDKGPLSSIVHKFVIWWIFVLYKNGRETNVMVLQKSSCTKIICTSMLKRQGLQYQYTRLLMRGPQVCLNSGQLCCLMRYIMCLLIPSVIEGRLSKMLRELLLSTYQKRQRTMPFFYFVRYKLYSDIENWFVAFNFQYAYNCASFFLSLFHFLKF